MLKCSEQQILEWIGEQIPFHAELDDGSLEIRIDDYTPTVCCALHAGHRLRPELNSICELNAEQRIYEEDPHTDALIDAMPITLLARDSRYEYDLNRTPEDAVYDQAWGKKIWSRPLTAHEWNHSIAKHSRFYRILDALLKVLIEKNGKILLFDIHSYNARKNVDAPSFNLGTAQVNRREYSGVIDTWLSQLSDIDIERAEPIQTAENEVFQGMGYLAQHCSPIADRCLVLPTEVKKFFCDEKTGALYPLVFQSLQEQFKSAMIETIATFLQHCDKPHIANIRNILSNELEPQVTQIDSKLYKLVKDVDILQFVNPINLQAEKRKFFKSGYRYQPDFRYRPIDMDPYLIKQQLYALPVDIIQDGSIRNLYRRVIEAYGDKVEQLASIGREGFLYNSLRYYGEPNQRDIDNARFLLHAPELQQSNQDNLLDSKAIETVIKEMAEELQLPCKIIRSSKMIANAMVKSDKVFINKAAQISALDAQALAHHEVGVHLVTSVNAQMQPLKLLQLGLPLYTKTQEGIAILSELLSGNINLTRLQTLALRVIAVSSMLIEQDFSKTFALLVEQYRIEPDRAFTLTARVYRGGGYTKDYLYLQGFKEALHTWQNDSNFNQLLIGKTSFTDFPVLSELVDRGLLKPPKYMSPAFQQPAQLNPIIDYLTRAIH